jgi:hypothetical protein
MSSQQEQVKINYEAFNKMLDGLLVDKRGKYALLRDGELIEVYDTLEDAVSTADKFFTDGRYSIQRITDQPVNLGLRSRAVHIG